MSVEGALKVAKLVESKVSELRKLVAGGIQGNDKGALVVAHELLSALKLLPGQAGNALEDDKWDTLWTNGVSSCTTMLMALRTDPIDIGKFNACTGLFLRVMGGMLTLIKGAAVPPKPPPSKPSALKAKVRDTSIADAPLPPPRLSPVVVENLELGDAQMLETLPYRLTAAGQWSGDYAGGCQNFPTYKRNPQWLLRVPAEVEVAEIAFVLDQCTNIISDCKVVGATLIYSKGHRFNEDLLLEDCVYGRTGVYINTPRVGWKGKLMGCPVPYVILPSTFEAGVEASFEIHVYSNTPKVSLEPAPNWEPEAHESNAYSTTLMGQWRGITAGGCTNHPTAVNNPTFYVTTGEESPDVRISLTQEQNFPIRYPPGIAPSKEEELPRSLVHIGMTMSYSLNDIRQGRKVASNGTFINAKTVTLSADELVPKTTYCVLPSTFEPGQEGVFTLSVSSNKPVEVVCSSLSIGDQYTFVQEWQAAWQQQNLEFTVGMYDAPQLGIRVKKKCSVHVSLQQIPEPGCPLFEIAAFLLDAGGRLVLHGGELCIANCGEFKDTREVSFEVTLEAKDTAYTLLPATMQWGYERRFTIVVRSTEPVETFQLSNLSGLELQQNLVSDVRSKIGAIRVHALRNISDRIELQPTVDRRISMRGEYNRFGLRVAISEGRRHSVASEKTCGKSEEDVAAEIEFNDLADKWEEDAEMDEKDPMAFDNITMAVEMAEQPMWPVRLYLAFENSEPEMLIDSRLTALEIRDIILAKYVPPSPVHHYALYIRATTHAPVHIPEHASLSTFPNIRQENLTLEVKAVPIEIRFDVGGRTEIHKVDIGKSVGGVVEHMCKQMNVRVDGFGLRVTEEVVGSEGEVTVQPFGAEDVSEGGWLDDPAKPISCVRLPPCSQRIVYFGKAPITVAVEVQFFEKINVRVTATTLDETVHILKKLVLESPLLKGHVVPRLFDEYHLFKQSVRKDIPLNEEASLLSAGVRNNDKLVLKLVKEEDEEVPERKKVLEEDFVEGLPEIWKMPALEEVTKYEFKEDGTKVLQLATVDALVVLISTEPIDVELMDTVLLTYQSFVTIPVFMQKLVERASVPKQAELPSWHPAKRMPAPEYANFKKSTTAMVKTVVINLAKYFSEYLDMSDRISILEAAEAIDSSGIVPKYVDKSLMIEEHQKRLAEGAEKKEGEDARSGLARQSAALRNRSSSTTGPVDLYLRVTCGDVTKVLLLSASFTVRQATNNVAGKFGIMDVMSYHLSSPEHGVLDDERTLGSYDFPERAEVFCRKKGSSGEEGAVRVAVHEVRIIFGSAMEVIKVAGNLFVSELYYDMAQLFKISDVAGYELNTVQHGALDGNRTIDSYGIVSNSEIFLQIKSRGERVRKPPSCLYTIVKTPVINQGPPPQSRKVPMRSATKLTVWDLNAQETARQMTLLDFTAYSAIEPIELLNQAWTKERHATRCKNVLAFIHRFNRLSSWVAHTVLSQNKVKKRAKLMAWHIKLAGKLFEIGNFHGVMAILGGLSNPAINRLKFTKDLLPKKALQEREFLETQMSMANGYKIYRELLERVENAIPYLGVFLCDLIFVEDGNPDEVDGMVNVEKRRMCRKAIHHIQAFQHNPYSFKPVPKVQYYLEICKMVDDKTLYDMSLELEPRGAEKSAIKF